MEWIMDDDIAASLLTSIQTDSLAIFLGAGLSMANPSNLPSAAKLAEMCYQKNRTMSGQALPANLENDLEALSTHFKEQQSFNNVFIQGLVPWEVFKAEPNPGHKAIADFLTAEIIEFGISTNLDVLIEKAAEGLGEKSFRATVTENDLNRFGLSHKPFLKIHGCCERDRDLTIWCTSQLAEEAICQKIDVFKTWIQGNLLNRDLLIIGFWTDWAYLNQVLLNCVSNIEPRKVMLVDPENEEALAEKAPDLWEWAHSGNISFHHIPQSGADFLDELRRRFSRLYLMNLVEESKSTYLATFGEEFNASIEFSENISTESLYSLRRDFNGKPVSEIPQGKHPDASTRTIGALHLFLIACGAQLEDSFYRLNSQSIRLINGAGQVLSQVKVRFSKEPPNLFNIDLTVCVGADKDLSPPNVIRSGYKNNIIRNDHTSEWITHHVLIERLRN